MIEAAIEIADLRFAYGEQVVLDGVTLAVTPGEIYGVVGADGAGKTTLLQLAVGQLSPRDGRIRVLGRDATDPALRGEIAYMPQGFGLYPDLSVRENLDFFADLHGLPRTVARERIVDLLQRTDLTGFEARRANNLSGGMMQKLALACALVSRPRAMFLDEPTTGVDPVSRRAFWRLLNGVRAEGVAILYGHREYGRGGALRPGRIAARRSAGSAGYAAGIDDGQRGGADRGVRHGGSATARGVVGVADGEIGISGRAAVASLAGCRSFAT